MCSLQLENQEWFQETSYMIRGWNMGDIDRLRKSKINMY